MIKINENMPYVYYTFTTNLWKKINDKYELVTKYGYCKFNKQTEEFDLDVEKTDPYFINNTREVPAARSKLVRIKRAHEKFTDRTGVATG